MSPFMRFRLSGEQNHRCAYCGERMLFPRELKHPRRGKGSQTDAALAERFRRATFEHVRPRSHGGADHWHNGVAACEFCNLFRNTAPPMEAFRAIQKMVREGRHPHQVFRETGRWEPPPRGLRYRPRPAAFRGEPLLVVMKAEPPPGAILAFTHFARAAESLSPAGVKATVEAMRAEARPHRVNLWMAAVLRQPRLILWAKQSKALVAITHNPISERDSDPEYADSI